MQKLLIAITCFCFFSFSGQLSAQEELTEKGGFSLNADEDHYFLFVLANRPADLPEVRGEITKYLWKFHPEAHLKITQIQVDGELEDVPLIHLQSFPNRAKAMEFYNGLSKNRPDFLQMGMTVDYFAISKSNYEKLIRAKSLKGYKPFFINNYK